VISADKARLTLSAEIKQKYQKWIIHRLLTVATFEREGKLSNPGGRAARAQCMEKNYGTGNPRASAARAHCSYFAPSIVQ
jgi:hypothetical protein